MNLHGPECVSAIPPPFFLHLPPPWERRWGQQAHQAHCEISNQPLYAIGGYDPRAKLVEKYFDLSSLAMIYEELDNGRPVIVADDAHCFVCDGYYRAIVIPSANERLLPFEQMLIGVQPMGRPGHVSRTVTLNEPGTLEA